MKRSKDTHRQLGSSCQGSRLSGASGADVDVGLGCLLSDLYCQVLVSGTEWVLLDSMMPQKETEAVA